MLFENFFKKKLFNQLSNAIVMVEQGLLLALLKDFSPHYDEDTAYALCAAISNTIWSRLPSNEKGKLFLTSNKNLIEEKLSWLGRQQEVCKLITATLRVKSTMAYMRGDDPGEVGLKLISEAERLRKYGIFIDGGDEPEPSKFMDAAARFLLVAQGK